MKKDTLKKKIAQKLLDLNNEGDNWNIDGIIEILDCTIDRVREEEREVTLRQVLSAFSNKLGHWSCTNSGISEVEDIIKEWCDKD